jgi:hypothetical protein
MRAFSFEKKKVRYICLTILGVVLFSSFQNCGPMFVRTGVSTVNSSTSKDSGNGSGLVTPPVPVPSPASIPAKFKSIIGGNTHVCLITNENTVQCMGQNPTGQLGNDSKIDSASLVQVPGLSDVKSLDVGISHSCAIKSDGAVWCWGQNDGGQLGNNSTMDSAIPVEVQGLMGQAKAVSTGANHTCVLTIQNKVKCFGSDVSTTSLQPVDIAGLGNAKAIVSAGRASCAITETNEVACWNISSLPLKIQNMTNIVSLSAGWGHLCGVDTQGQVFCTRDFKTGTQIPTLLGVKSVVAGGFGLTSCAVLKDDTMRCWGNTTTPGSGTMSPKFINADFGPNKIQSPVLSKADFFNCFISTDGHFRCFEKLFFPTKTNLDPVRLGDPIKELFAL